MAANNSFFRSRDLVAFLAGAVAIVVVTKNVRTIIDWPALVSSDEATTPEGIERQTEAVSPLARRNRAFIGELQKALDTNAECNIERQIWNIKQTWRKQRQAESQSRREQTREKQWVQADRVLPPMAERNDVERLYIFKSLPKPQQSLTFLRPLSATFVKELRAQTMHAADYDPTLKPECQEILSRIIEGAQTLCQDVVGESSIARCTPSVVVKITPCPCPPESLDMTEYSALEYLERHIPYFPAPKPHGLAQDDDNAYMFMTYIPGVQVESIWGTLNQQCKGELSAQLDKHFSTLRKSLPFPAGQQLGGVGGEGCKDTRAGYRHSRTPINTYKQYLEWQMANPRFGSQAYIDFWRQLAFKLEPNRIVFTHGDPHPGNIMVEADLSEPSGYRISGIVDWAESGFYPEWFESTKATKLQAFDSNDWYNYLPDSIAPARYSSHWAIMNNWATMVELS